MTMANEFGEDQRLEAEPSRLTARDPGPRAGGALAQHVDVGPGGVSVHGDRHASARRSSDDHHEVVREHHHHDDHHDDHHGGERRTTVIERH